MQFVIFKGQAEPEIANEDLAVSSFFSKKGIFREGALTMFPFKEAFQRETGEIVRAVNGNNDKLCLHFPTLPFLEIPILPEESLKKG